MNPRALTDPRPAPIRTAPDDCQCESCKRLTPEYRGRLGHNRIEMTVVETVLAQGDWLTAKLRNGQQWLGRVFVELTKPPVIEVRLTGAPAALYVKILVPAQDMPLVNLEKMIEKLRKTVAKV